MFRYHHCLKTIENFFFHQIQQQLGGLQEENNKFYSKDVLCFIDSIRPNSTI